MYILLYVNIIQHLHVIFTGEDAIFPKNCDANIETIL